MSNIDDSRIDEMAHHIAVNEGLENAYAPLTEQDIKEILMASLDLTPGACSHDY